MKRTIPLLITALGGIVLVVAFFIPAFESWGEGVLTIAVALNALKVPVLSAAKRNINEAPPISLAVARDDICNLVLPDDYTLRILGWMTKTEYIEQCRQYRGWVWPQNSQDKTRNQAWTMITDKDRTALTRAGFDDCIKSKPTRLDAGWLKTTGKGGGACCYVYPNLGGGRGGFVVDHG